MKMKNSKTIFGLFALLLLIAVNGGSRAQSTVSDVDVAEQIYLNTDRDIYFAGENILFSVQYLIEGQKINPALSRVVYLELINTLNGSRVVQRKFQISNFTSHGSIAVPAGIPSGNYLLRAYTQYQRNFGASGFEHRLIAVFNAANNENNFTFAQNTDTLIMVPEGNVWLFNERNKIVFWVPPHLRKAGNTFSVTDSRLNTVEKIELSEFGLAQAELVAHVTENYRLLVETNKGDSIVELLPKAQGHGFQAQTYYSGKTLLYTVTHRKVGLANGAINCQLEVWNRHLIKIHQQNINVSNTVESIYLDALLFDKGLNYIVLRGRNGAVENVNTVFVRPQPLGKIEIATNTNVFAGREEANTCISVQNESANDLGQVSVSVVKHGANKENHGFLPSVYLKDAAVLNDFLTSNPEMNAETIKLVLTLFDQHIEKDIFNTNVAEGSIRKTFIAETRDVTLSGVVRNKKTLKPVAGHKIYLSVFRGQPQLHTCNSDAAGAFIFSLNHVTNIGNIFICPENDTDDQFEILINDPFENENPNAVETTAFLDSSDAGLIDELFMNAQIGTHFPPKSINAQPIGLERAFNIDNGKSTTLLSDFVTLKNMQELFVEIVPNANFRKSKGQYSFVIFDSNGDPMPGSPLVLLDNIPIFDANKIMQLDIALIEKVDVIYKTYILGENVFQGVIMITGKTKNFAGVEFPKSSIFVEYQGIDESGEILSEQGISDNCRIPDFRTTLYWNPFMSIRPGSNCFSFQTSDSKGKYDIVVKGYDSKGKLFYGKHQISVQ